MNQQRPQINVPPAQYKPSTQQPSKKSKLPFIIIIIIILVIGGGAAAYYFLVYNQEDTNKNSEITKNENKNTQVTTSSCVATNFKCSSLTVKTSSQDESYYELVILGVTDPTISLVFGRTASLSINNNEVSEGIYGVVTTVDNGKYIRFNVKKTEYIAEAQAKVTLPLSNGDEIINFALPQTDVSINADSTANVNQSLNENVNLSSNVNGQNVNSGSNVNSVSNANQALQNINTNTATKPDSKVDADGDGLDDEEEFLHATDKGKPDTDDDGYKDLDEINSYYSPIGSGRITIDQFTYYCEHLFSFDNDKFTDQDGVEFTISPESITQICEIGTELEEPILNALIEGDQAEVEVKVNIAFNEMEEKCQVFDNIYIADNICYFSIISAITGFVPVE